jgi:hypothetical protein
MRSIPLVVIAAALAGCGPSAEDKAKMRDVKAYMLRSLSQ